MQRGMLNRATMRVEDTQLPRINSAGKKRKNHESIDSVKRNSCSSIIQPQQKYEKKIISFIVFPLFVCAAAYAQGITWTKANPMNKARAFFVAVELLNGNVLVAGGFDGSLPPSNPPNFKN